MHKETWYARECSIAGADDWFRYGHKTFDSLENAQRELPHAEGYETRVVRITTTIEVEPMPDREYVDLARQKWQKEGEIEIDDNAVVSISDDGGAYVQAWVWVYDPQEDGK